ncbi:unnamed protein product [Linum tenue]|uniref:Cytochrome P450 n=7 Tax=Linum tenue TaxID=586396 RepID=A0AAV0K9X4_9ROSI|nr:unnamed protein product [Linum tenue]
MGSYPVVLVSSPPLADEIFREHDVSFAGKPESPLADRLLFGDSGFVTAPYGEYWRFMKKMCVTELFSTRQLERSRSVRREELARFLRRLAMKSQATAAVDLRDELLTLGNNIICRMAMSMKCSEEDNEAKRYRTLVNATRDLTLKMLLTSMLGPFKKLGRFMLRKQATEVPARFDELLEGILKKHEERSGGGADDETNCDDLMDILLRVSKDPNAEVNVTRKNIKAFFLDLFLAGTGTTTDATVWVMAELINHPEVFKRVRKEIHDLIGSSNNGRLVEETDIPNLPYLQAVVKEAMRLHPPVVVVPRACRETCNVGGFDIPKGTAVAINVYSIMRDPAVWVNPDDYSPERFLKSSDDSGRRSHHGGFIPFGGGRRMCVGSAMALSVIHCAVAAMVHCYDWKLENGEESVNMETTLGFNMALAKPLVCLPKLVCAESVFQSVEVSSL